MMAQAPQEMADITAISDATVLNTGTPDEEKFRSCLLCGRAAEPLHQPVVLDPVGVGASPWRLERTEALLRGFRPTLLRVNLGEARALTQAAGEEQGVDSLAPASHEERLDAALRLARSRNTAVLLSGPEDIVTNGVRSWRITGGSGWMSRVTGTGCMLSVLCGVFAAVEPDIAQAAVLASAFWKVCSRRAEDAAGEQGPGSFRAALMDAAAALTPADFAAEATIELL